MSTPTSPPPARLQKSASLTPSIRRFLHRYPPAILDDSPPPRQLPSATTPQRTLSSFDQRFPDGYKVADSSIPLFPDEVPYGSEKLFSPIHKPVCRTVTASQLGLLCLVGLTRVVFLVGIPVLSAVDGGGVYVRFAADTVEFGDRAEGVLDAGAVAEVEF
jgi:hypothetical protein